MSLNNLSLKSTLSAFVRVGDLSDIIISYYFLSPIEEDNALLAIFQTKMMRRAKTLLDDSLDDADREFSLRVPRKSLKFSVEFYQERLHEISFNLSIMCDGKESKIIVLFINTVHGKIYYEEESYSQTSDETSDEESSIRKKNNLCNISDKYLKTSREFYKILRKNINRVVHDYTDFPYSSDSD